jgi:hypothetical protein
MARIMVTERGAHIHNTSQGEGCLHNQNYNHGDWLKRARIILMYSVTCIGSIMFIIWSYISKIIVR